MTGIGYILLAVIGYVALKAFGGTAKGVPSFPGNAASPIDPKTGAKIINTSGLMPGVNSRIAATDIGSGKMWCPYPFKLYKDLADGKFYCYNENVPIDTSSATADATFVSADAPAQIDTSSFMQAATLTTPIDPSDPAYLAMIRGNVLELAPQAKPAVIQEPEIAGDKGLPPGVFYI